MSEFEIVYKPPQSNTVLSEEGCFRLYPGVVLPNGVDSMDLLDIYGCVDVELDRYGNGPNYVGASNNHHIFRRALYSYRGN